jgi:hypothetical protein
MLHTRFTADSPSVEISCADTHNLNLPEIPPSSKT